MSSIISRHLKLIKLKNISYFRCQFASSTVAPQPVHYVDNDPAPLFFNHEVQNQLKILTRINLEKVYRQRKMQDQKLSLPEYKFLTTEQLNELMNEVQSKVEDKLQMPPVVKIRQEIKEILSKDPALLGYDKAKYVFTDITYGKNDRQRLIVTRQPDGTLEKSDWETRSRLNQLYFPQQGRQLQPPRMFQTEYLLDLLDRKEYEFILDAACLQFEPDDVLYQTVCSITYQAINKAKDFELLRSTRHFGPFVFYLAWTKDIDLLMIDLLEVRNIEEASSLVKLYNRIHNLESNGSELDLISKYIMEKSGMKGLLELAFQKCFQNKEAINV